MLLHSVSSGQGDTGFILMHFYGGSHHEWDVVAPLLASRFRVVAVDMPGFGESRDVPGYTIDAMADTMERFIASLGLQHFVLVGHSFSGKVALVLARRQLPGLAGLVLVTPSPLALQPMRPGERESMRTQHNTRESAEKFIDGVTLNRLPDPLREPMVQSAMNCNPEAWLTWPDNSSKEDWSELVGVVKIPALVVAGAEDPSLPAPIQEVYTLPHLAHGRMIVIPGTGHLIPLEQPQRLAVELAAFADVLAPA